ncbi:hypothetical protein [Anabaena subtropica]|uniref:Uncharacterized protein n=1 Tax=Anabaena subtropica FACHB-260 TaxID=2692884 RepID=A0ABR8CMT7_9NOST|nr:hypothetical protein [Anabaena subtropica]MBD2344183.1 hypothetical protein [Anabaena subtropica FACHB-260]
MNNNLYQASLKALTEAGVPQDVAAKASEVVAKDDPCKENLGRTTQDQQAVNEAMDWYRRGNG